MEGISYKSPQFRENTVQYSNVLPTVVDDLGWKDAVNPQSTVHIYLEYHSVCPLVRIGTPPPQPAIAAPPPPPLGTKEGGDTLACG
jgi:hypothetical protein